MPIAAHVAGEDPDNAAKTEHAPILEMISPPGTVQPAVEGLVEVLAAVHLSQTGAQGRVLQNFGNDAHVSTVAVVDLVRQHHAENAVDRLAIRRVELDGLG